jgi:hypothetical protein
MYENTMGILRVYYCHISMMLTDYRLIKLTAQDWAKPTALLLYRVTFVVILDRKVAQKTGLAAIGSKIYSIFVVSYTLYSFFLK